MAKLVLRNTVRSAEKTRHWIIKWDVSGSMSWALNQVKRDMNGFIALLPEGHFVSIIIFSGHNESRLIAGAVRSDKNGKSVLVAAIEGVRILSTTVFSEPLRTSIATAKALAQPGIEHKSVLFTDGCPVPTMHSEREEISRSLDVAREMRQAGISLSTIGYGNYYNERFLLDLTKVNGGVGINRHINDVTNFATVIGDIRSVGEKTTPIDADLCFRTPQGFTGVVLASTPQIQKVGDGKKVQINAFYNGEVTLYIDLLNKSNELSFSGVVNGEKWESDRAKVQVNRLSQESAMEAALAAASWAFQSGDFELSAQLLNESGHPVLATMAGNAHTDRERLTVGDEMRRILQDNGIRQRYATKKHIGGGEARCTVNLLRVLLEEDCTVFIPRGTYQKTTVTVIEEGMRHKPNAKIKMIDIQSHEQRYNISMKTVVDVEEKDASGKWKDGTRFRNYVIVKDGNLHQQTLEAYLTEKAFMLCQVWGVVDENVKFSETKLYTLDLTSLPMIVASWANPRQLGLVDLMKEEMILEVRQTALNAKVKELRTAGAVYPKKSSVEGSPVDFYMAEAYEYTLKGFAVPKTISLNHITNLEQAETEARAVRKRLLIVRCVKRLILFAMDKSGNKLFAGVEKTPVARSKNGKMEQTVSLASLGYPDLSLRRVTWTETIEITGKMDEESVSAAA